MFLNCQRGNIAVETALILPVLLTVILGGVDLLRFCFLDLVFEMSSARILQLVAENTNGDLLNELGVRAAFQHFLGGYSAHLLEAENLAFQKFAPLSGMKDFYEANLTYPFHGISPFTWLSFLPENLTYKGVIYAPE